MEGIPPSITIRVTKIRLVIFPIVAFPLSVLFLVEGIVT